VAFDGGSRKDIWTNVPDVLASIANFMSQSGWDPALPWGFEVTLPRGYGYGVDRASFAEWAKRGVTRADGTPMPSTGEALMFFPAGWRGPAFLITKNFFVIKAYNTSDAYALSAGVLADRIGGGGGIAHPWPADDRLDRAALLAAQRSLQRLGFYDDKPRGRWFSGPGNADPARRRALTQSSARAHMWPRNRAIELGCTAARDLP
jgi:hypothetical protein